MTPLQFAREECANYQSDGSCLGVVIEDDLSVRRCDSKPKCLLAAPKRCGYFEECVAPMADMAGDPRRAVALQVAVAEYRQATNQKPLAARPCPECGLPLQRGKQLCPACAARRRKDTYWCKNAKRRVGLTTEVQKNDPKSPIKAGGILAVRENAIEDSHDPQNDPTSVVKAPWRPS